MGYYLNYVNQYEADVLDFFEFDTNKPYATIMKEQLENHEVIVPKMPYYPYKIINGEKVYIKEPILNNKII